MCVSHTIYHLCGHVKIRTIVQCADIIDKLISSGSPITCTHQVCEDTVGDNVHVFPDVCTKCKVTGVIGDAMEVPGVKLDVLRAWELQSKGKSASVSPEEEDEAEKINELETLEEIARASDEDTSSASSVGSSASGIHSSNSTSSSSTQDLSQIKTRVAALVARTEQLLVKMRAGRHSTGGKSSS
jgi:hypothetical protein